MSARTVIALVASAVLLTGCGAAAALSAGSQVPSLDAALVKIDSAVAHGRYPAARTSLITLINETREAERNGSLSKAAATRIIEAAHELLAALPRPGASSKPVTQPVQRFTPSTSPSSSPSPSPTPTPTPTKPAPSAHPKSTAAPTPTPEPTDTPTPDASPTASPAGLISPTP